jgi:hypothetical protein
MKFFVSILLTALLALALGFYLSWWSVAVAAFVVAAFVRQRPGMAWLSGFLGIFLLWGGLALWIDMENQQILSKRIAQLLMLGGSSIALILVTAFIGSLVGGMAALTASYMRK